MEETRLIKKEDITHRKCEKHNNPLADLVPTDKPNFYRILYKGCDCYEVFEIKD